MYRRALPLVVLVAAVALAGCTTPEAYREYVERGRDDTSGLIVHLRDNEFVDERITVEVGTTVTWVQNDSWRHTVTFEERDFDEELTAPGERVELSFPEAGTFDYRCKPHSTGYRNWDQMVGRVTVVE